MGLIRKSLNLLTAGAVRPESKKQRYMRVAAGIPSQYEQAADSWRALGTAVASSLRQEAARQAELARGPEPDEPGWFPDPYARFPRRWWNGTAWTARVRNGLEESTDEPPPPPRPKGEGLLENIDRRDKP